MVSIKTIYSRAFAVLRKKPFLLWGISLLAMLLSALSVPLLGVIPAASIAVSMLLQTAMTLIYLRGYRGEEIAVTQLFDTFKDWKTVKRVLCGMGWASLWIFLWSLIPVAGIVFGTIRAYEYRLTPYILMHEPDVPITEAIKVSREKTRGYKAKMFGADILYVVVIAAAEILLALLATIRYIGVLFGILSVVITIAASLFGPLFLGLVQAAFYEEITHRRVCPRCGVELSPDARFCYNCGYGADGNTGSTPEHSGKPLSIKHIVPKNQTPCLTVQEISSQHKGLCQSVRRSGRLPDKLKTGYPERAVLLGRAALFTKNFAARLQFSLLAAI